MASASFVKGAGSVLRASESSGFHGCRLHLETYSLSDDEHDGAEHRNHPFVLRMLEPATAAVVASFIASGLHESWASVHNKLRQYRLASNMYTLGLKPAKAVTPLPEKIAAVIPLTASEQHCVDLSRELAAKELVHDLRKVVKVPRLKKVSAPDVETALHAISERTVLEDEFPVQSILVNDLFKVAIRNVVDEVEVVTHGITKLAAVPPSAVSSATSAVSSAVSASTAVSATSAVSATASAVSSAAGMIAGESVTAAATAGAAGSMAAAPLAGAGGAASGTVAVSASTATAAAASTATVSAASTATVASTAAASATSSATLAASASSSAGAVAGASTSLGGASALSSAATTGAGAVAASTAAAAPASVAAGSTVLSTAATGAATSTLSAASTIATAATSVASAVPSAASIGVPAAAASAASGPALAGNIAAAIGAVGSIPSASEVGASLGVEVAGGSLGAGVSEGLMEAGAQIAVQVGDMAEAASQIQVCGVEAGDLQASIDVVNWEQACGVSSWLSQTEHFADVMARAGLELMQHVPHLPLDVGIPALCFNAFSLSLAALACVHALKVPEVQRLKQAIFIQKVSEPPRELQLREPEGPASDADADAEELRRRVEMGLSQIG